MLEEYENNRRKQVSGIRSVMDYTMGIVFIAIGLYFLLSQTMGWQLMGRKGTALDYVIGVVFLVYGGWRVYRGYKKNYFN